MTDDALKKATDAVFVPEEPPPPWTTWGLEKLLRITRRALVEYGLIDAAAVKVMFQTEAEDPPGVGMNGAAPTDENTKWAVKAIVTGFEDLKPKEVDSDDPDEAWDVGPVEKSRHEFEGHGSTPEEAHVDLYENIQRALWTEAEELQRKERATLEARKTLSGDVERLAAMWTSTDPQPEELNLLEDSDDILAWLKAEGIPHDENHLEPHYQDWVAAGKPRVTTP